MSHHPRHTKHIFDHLIFPNPTEAPSPPTRRAVYTASLEAHIDALHSYLIDLGYFPVPFEELAPLKGMSARRAKNMIIALQFEITRRRGRLRA